MHLIERYQDEAYSLALSLIYSPQKSKEILLKAFEDTFDTSSGDFHKIKLDLYKNMLKEIGFFTVQRRKCKGKDILTTVKRKLSLFDKKAFVLKHECGLTTDDIAYVLEVEPLKIKKSLLLGLEKLARLLEDEVEV